MILSYGLVTEITFERNLRRNITTTLLVILAHRLSTIIDFDLYTLLVRFGWHC